MAATHSLVEFIQFVGRNDEGDELARTIAQHVEPALCQDGG